MCRQAALTGAVALCLWSSALAQTEAGKPPESAAGQATADVLVVSPSAKTDASRSGDFAAVPSKLAESANEGQTEQDRGATCATAATVVCGTPLTFAISGTTPATSTKPDCWGSVGYGPQWFKFTANASCAIVTTCGDPGTNRPLQPDTEIAIFSGTCSALTQIACSDDGCAYGTNPQYLSSAVASDLNVGQTYFILVAKWNSSTLNNGNYVLSVTCSATPIITCQFADQPEWELDPCGQDPGMFPWYFGTFSVNNGCNVNPPAFAELLQCNSTVCGTMTMARTLEGTTVRDTDWYRLHLTAPGRIYVNVEAEFAPVAAIMAAADVNQPIRCDNYATVAARNATAPDFSVELTYPDASLPVAPAGEYWVMVSADWSEQTIPCTRDYRAFIGLTPCALQNGACCLPGGTACLDAQTAPNGTREYCTAQGGTWYGPGSTCTTTVCFVCPEGFTVLPPETDFNCATAPYVYTDTTNAGCGTAAKSFTVLPLPDPNLGVIQVCGVAGTHFDADPPGANLRDNDWYQVGTSEVWPVNTTKEVTASVVAEFPVEVLLAQPGYGYGATSPTGHECDAADQTGVKAWRILSRATGAPGEFVQVSNCVLASPSDKGRAWVIVRPALLGTPREIPCGSRYSLRVEYISTCPNTGACCYAAGCALRTFVACNALGGTFWGEGSSCEQGCCACEPTNTPENEPGCAFPDGVNSSCFYIIGGTVPTAAVATPITPGTQYICGAGGWVDVGSYGYMPEMDCYGFTLPTVGTIRAWLYSEFDSNVFLLKKGTAPDYCDDATIWYFGLGEPRCQWNLLERINTVPGDYQVCVRISRDDERAFICNDGEHPKYSLYAETPGLTGACCYSYAGVQYCGNLSAAECAAEAGSYYYGDNTTCDDANVCAGACCTPDGCVLEFAAYCDHFMGYDTNCAYDWCSSGACCVHGTCTFVDPAACAAAGGVFQGAATTCSTNLCRCAGDANCDGTITWRDIDYFIAGINDNEPYWRQQFLPGTPTCPYVNLDCSADGHVNWRDIDPFIARMNTICP